MVFSPLVIKFISNLLQEEVFLIGAADNHFFSLDGRLFEQQVSESAF